jgi:hypothetical protein
MTDLAAHEFSVLRDTVKSRASARPLVCLAGLSVWAATVLAVLIWLPNPIAAVVPLMVLVTSFEVIRSLHLGVERIGRYLQVFFEEGDLPPLALSERMSERVEGLRPPAWERSAMVFGPSVPGAGVHPFFLPIYLMATVVNLLPVALPGPIPLELVALSVPHAAFVIWMLYCDRGMRKQRTTELARYRALKKDSLRS